MIACRPDKCSVLGEGSDCVVKYTITPTCAHMNNAKAQTVIKLYLYT